MKKYIALAVLICLVSCRARIQYVPLNNIEATTTILRDTIIQIQLVPYRDTVYLRDTVSYLSNEYGESWARWTNGHLSHSLNIFPYSAPVKIVYKDVYRDKKTEVPVEVERKLTRWEQTKMDVGGWAIGGLIGCVVIGIGYVVRWIIKKRK